MFLADVALRTRDYAEADLFTPQGRYGDIRWMPIIIVVVATVMGWGLVTNRAAPWLAWQGYFLAPFALGGVDGRWTNANLSVVVALFIGLSGLGGKYPDAYYVRLGESQFTTIAV